jgi:hypothetical protein
VFTAITPVRLLDTRVGVGLSGRLTAGTLRTFTIAGVAGIPATATAISGNVTVVGQTAAGYVSVGPTITVPPSSSTINVPAGDIRANNTIVQVGLNGTISAVYMASPGATTHLLFDATGYFTPTGEGARYTPVTPVRLLDSRSGNGLAGPFSTKVPRTVPIAGRGGVPSAAVAVTGNLAIVGQTSAGYAFIGPTATAAPTSSTINVPAGDIRANGTAVRLGTGGTVSAVWIGGTGSSTHIIFDVTGYFLSEGGAYRFVAVNPTRLLDSRTGNGRSGAFVSASPANVAIAGRTPVPADAKAIAANLTVVGQTTAGYAFVGPTASAPPAASTLNFPIGDVRANGLTVALSGSGAVGVVWMGGGGAKAHLILDVGGYWR